MTNNHESLKPALLRNRLLGAVILVAMLVCLVTIISPSTTKRADATVPRPLISEDGKLPDGVYALLREGITPDETEKLAEPHHVLVGHTTEGEQELVAVAMHSYLPLELARVPVLSEGENGHFSIDLKLAPNLESALEAFTGRHKRIAIVLDGEIVTRHKVHGPIKGGEVKISRCGDERCEVIYAKLTD